MTGNLREGYGIFVGGIDFLMDSIVNQVTLFEKATGVCQLVCHNGSLHFHVICNHSFSDCYLYFTLVYRASEGEASSLLACTHQNISRLLSVALFLDISYGKLFAAEIPSQKFSLEAWYSPHLC